MHRRLEARADGSRRPSAWPATTIGGALFAVALAGCGAEAERVAEGEVVAASGATAEGTGVDVVVPTGTLEVVVGEPAEEIGDRRAPDGGSLVRITTSFRDADVRRDVWELAARGGQARAITVGLEADGEEYDLGVARGGATGTDNGDPAPDDLIVGVDGSPDEIDDLVLHVTYDGLTQRVSVPDGEREPGPADALYDEAPDPDAVPPATCEGALSDPAARPSGLRCEVGSVRHLPYVPDLGWAEEGRSWLVVGAGVDIPSIYFDAAPGATTYRPAGTSLTLTVDGTDPSAVLDEESGGTRLSGQFVLDVVAPGEDAAPVGAVELVADYRLAVESGPGPAARDLRYEAAAEVGLVSP